MSQNIPVKVLTFFLYFLDGLNQLIIPNGLRDGWERGGTPEFQQAVARIPA
jgi:hypothetical protein